MPSEGAPLEYPLHVQVDGESFSVARDPLQAGVYHYDWASGPNSGCGFTSGINVFDESSGRITHDHRPTLAEHVEAIRNFLGLINPGTGYIEDD